MQKELAKIIDELMEKQHENRVEIENTKVEDLKVFFDGRISGLSHAIDLIQTLQSKLIHDGKQ